MSLWFPGVRGVRMTRPEWPYGINRNSPQAQGLVAWWPMRTASNYDNDLVASRQLSLGFLLGTTWGAHPLLGRAPLLNGSTTYAAAVTTYDEFNFSGSHSVSCWFYATGNNSTVRGLGTHRDTIGAVNGQYGLYINSTNVLFASITAGGAFRSTLGATTVSLNTLYHATAVFDDEKDEQRIYLNGRRDGVTTGFTHTLTAHADTVMWGGYNVGSGSSLFAGLIADGRLYKRALTDAEVLELYLPQTRWELYLSPSVRPFAGAAGASLFSPFEVVP